MSIRTSLDHFEITANGFVIASSRYGYALYGTASSSDRAAIIKRWRENGYAIVHSDLAKALGAVSAVVRSLDAAEAWIKEIESPSAKVDWLSSGDCSQSSKTIYATFTGRWDILHGGSGGGDAPYYAADFGRCHRLLKRNPDWRKRLHEVGAVCDKFRHLIPQWEFLEALYEAGDHETLSLRICELRTQKSA